MSLSIESIESRIKSYEEELVKIVSNHTAMSGALAELKQLLALVSPVVDAIVPEAVPVLDVVNSVLDDVSPE